MGYDTYDRGEPPFGAALWLEAECCGGKRLWAPNELHLAYLEPAGAKVKAKVCTTGGTLTLRDLHVKVAKAKDKDDENKDEKDDD